jgi:hypothetical protein
VTDQNDTRLVPDFLTGQDGEPPYFVNTRLAPTEEVARAQLEREGYGASDGYEASRVLMRELDPIACKIRGVEDGYWAICTKRARNPVEFWRLDES